MAAHLELAIDIKINDIVRVIDLYSAHFYKIGKVYGYFNLSSCGLRDYQVQFSNGETKCFKPTALEVIEKGGYRPLTE
jgi:tRNA U38,U39,U40 pseudouridine synthase TruA